VSFASIPSPAENGFHIGPLFFHAYGIMYVIAVAAAIYLSGVRWKQIGGDPEIAWGCAKWGFPAGLIGGRIYFLITTPSQIPSGWSGPFAIWDGGLGIWGGIAGGVLGGLYYLRRREKMSWFDIRLFMNVVSPALLVAQAFGRIGNYFNQELFGKPSSLPWALQISYVHRPPGYHRYPTFQPTFLYEIIWDVAFAIFIILLDNRGKLRPGAAFPLYVAGYSAFRIFEETLRIDYSVHILGMRLNFWIALIGTIGGLLWFIRLQTRPIAENPEAPPAPPSPEYSQSGAA
jgi:prolipoprotein diacylglyceryl transferase